MTAFPDSAVVLVSGGMDSTTLVYWLSANGVEVVPLFVNYGQHCATTEHTRVMQLLPPGILERLHVLDVSSIYGASQSRLIREADLWVEDVASEDLYLPYRNAMFLTLGAAFAQARGIHHLYAAFINSNHAVEIDCSAAFFDQLATMLKGFGSVELHIPFRDYTKTDVARLGIQVQAPVASTYSCQVSSAVPCGACPNCVERLNAFQEIEELHRGSEIEVSPGSPLLGRENKEPANNFEGV
jgi:7-cyano-7-deazaguanine synthase